MFLLFQKFEKAMDIDENTEEPQLVHAKVTGDMTREEVVQMVLKTLSPDEQDGDMSQVKLLDGYYKPKQVTLVQHWKVDGDKIECEDPYNTYDFRPSFEYGDFGKNFQTKYRIYTSLFVNFRGSRRKNCGKNWQMQIQHGFEVFLCFWAS